MIASKHLQFVVMFFGCLLAVYVGSNIVTLPIPVLCILGAIILLGVWALIAGQNWWFLIFTCATVGGTMHLGFKVFPYEIGFALAMIGLLPLVLTQDRKVFQTGRKALPAIFYITAAYVTVRLMIDVVPAAGYRGNLGRISFNTSWPFLFAFLFHQYGSLDAFRKAVGCMFWVLLVRAMGAIVGYVTGIPLVVPGINYYLSMSSEDSLQPMRGVAVALLMAALVIFHGTRSIIYRMLLIPVCFFSVIMVVMGEGRFATLAMLLVPFSFLLWSRRWLILFLAFTTLFAGLCYINVAPETLSLLPKQAGRALSGLVFTRNEGSEQFATEASDQWHDLMRKEGTRRWLESPKNFLFGDGITPSPDLVSNMKSQRDMDVAIKNAANIGGFENGFSCELSFFGTVGFVLYACFFIRMGRDIWPYLVRRPQGTLWEGLAFWGVYAPAVWYVGGYFQGAIPGIEVIVICMAWEAVNEGRLDDEPEEVAPPVHLHRRAGSAGLPIALAPAARS